MEDSKIYLITYVDEKDKGLYVSHGIGNNTLKTYTLPQMKLSEFSPNRDSEGYFLKQTEA